MVLRPPFKSARCEVAKDASMTTHPKARFTRRRAVFKTTWGQEYAIVRSSNAMTNLSDLFETITKHLVRLVFGMGRKQCRGTCRRGLMCARHQRTTSLVGRKFELSHSSMSAKVHANKKQYTLTELFFMPRADDTPAVQSPALGYDHARPSVPCGALPSSNHAHKDSWGGTYFWNLLDNGPGSLL
eukprot:247893-Amphidinium_carterae.2